MVQVVSKWRQVVQVVSKWRQVVSSGFQVAPSGLKKPFSYSAIDFAYCEKDRSVIKTLRQESCTGGDSYSVDRSVAATEIIIIIST